MSEARQPETDRSVAPPPAGAFDAALERRIGALGRTLLQRARSARSGILSGDYWTERLMDWSTRDEAFKDRLFRFVDVFPALTTPEQVQAHLEDYFLRSKVRLPFGVGAVLRAGRMSKSITSRIIAGQVRSMAGRFIAGSDVQAALPVLEKLWRSGLGHTITLLGEECLSEREALAYQEAYLRILRALAAAASSWPVRERAEHDHLGPIPRINVSLKLSALHPALDPVASDAIAPALQETIRPILDEAKRLGAQIHFDNEHRALKDLIFDVFMRCAEETDTPIGVVVQAYLQSAEDDAQRLIDFTRRTGRQITIRLVKGAYWDSEDALAVRMDWPGYVWSHKSETDACFERVARMFVDATPRTAGEGGTKLALGSHNARSIAATLALLERRDLPLTAVELQMLYGMAGELKTAAAGLEYRVRDYVPVGELIPGMAYLVRRLLENTSNESWLKASFSDRASDEALLASPHAPRPAVSPHLGATGLREEQPEPPRTVMDCDADEPFLIEPQRHFAVPAVRRAFSKAIHRPPPREFQAEGTESADPEEAITAARAALLDWGTLPAFTRGAIVLEAASIMQRRRDELAGLMIRHAGMTWRDADLEVCRAIEFCVYHAQWAADLMGGRPGAARPRRVCLLSPPHGAPLAGLCAPVAAALTTGNTVLLAPDAATRAIARIFIAIMDRAGCPRKALRLLSESAARVLSSRPELERIEPPPGRGGTVLVDESADLDSAVAGVRRAAFAFSGQSRHACKRAIVLHSVYDAFLERLCESTAGLKIGDPIDPSTHIGPVLDESTREAAEHRITAARAEARPALAMDLPGKDALLPGRPYVAPHIFADVPPTGGLAREPSPGPVLALMRVASFAQAIEAAIANEPITALGVYSRTPSHTDRVRGRSSAPLLFINCPIESPPVGGWLTERHVAPGPPVVGLEHIRRFIEPSMIGKQSPYGSRYAVVDHVPELSGD
ncbi:MAG: proline dehydrogenase family protein [Planctomycetota bacterium]|nr:proline dehydrogenase family protein [Planctomycetota bacterium]